MRLRSKRGDPEVFGAGNWRQVLSLAIGADLGALRVRWHCWGWGLLALNRGGDD
jgi:hypothetical protein